MNVHLRLGLAALLAAGCAGDSDPATHGEGGFVDVVRSAGIDWTMNYLPEEQGENFKINLYDHGCGVALADVDGDGDDDIYFSNQLGPNALYRNDGGGKFTDVTAEAGPIALADRISVMAVFADIDNDGDQDLYVTSTRGGNAMFRNEGGGKFTDVTEAAGLKWVGHTQGATFFDADGDGFLDLLITNTAMWTTSKFDRQGGYYRGVSTLNEVVASPIEYNAFFRNDGDGTFTTRTLQSGLRGAGWGGDTVVLDFDEDGDQDVLIGNMFGNSFLYRNEGAGRFVDVTQEVLGRTPWGAVGANAFDFDNDQRLDLFIVDMHSDMWIPPDYDMDQVEPARKYRGFFGQLLEQDKIAAWEETRFAQQVRLRYDRVFFGNGVYANRGEGRFEEVSAEVGGETFWPWGVAPADFDNDGWQDVYIPSGMGHPYKYWPSPLLMNQEGRFVDRTKEAGLDPPPGGVGLGIELAGKEAVKSARSAATADLDGDGRVDLVVNNFNAAPHVLMNRWPKRNYVAFRLVGTHCNRDAVGARVKLTAGGVRMVRQVSAAQGYLAQSSKTLHFGLGNATKIDSCEVIWPDGRRQELKRVEPNRVHEIVEPGE